MASLADPNDDIMKELEDIVKEKKAEADDPAAKATKTANATMKAAAKDAKKGNATKVELIHVDSKAQQFLLTDYGRSETKVKIL